ncbi:metal-dependent transcriptional regulator [Akkermansiaceae bacterium]|nr:metal-dependent transcriptional regulator [Akkermansiaceae bacterium]MDB4526596.1 metal-dependent transcriptional regulator [bacterium]
MPSSTVENYLKAIWSLQGPVDDGELVLIGQVAEKLSVTPGTATTMMNQLEKKGLVEYRPRRGVRLKEEGRKAAMQVLRRHRLIETFLVEVMKLDWAEVHEDAEVLEHVVSDRLLRRMDEMLHHPTHDPHGAPIPSSDGELRQDGTAVLADCQPGRYLLKRVREDQPAFLQWLSELQLLPGTEFVLSAINSMAGTLSLQLGGQDAPVQLSTPASRSLLVVKVS